MESIRRDVVAALAVTTTVAYGVLFYSFGALLEPMRLDLGISVTVATGALTTAALVGAVLAVPVGRWLDARGGRGAMTTAATLAGLLGVLSVTGRFLLTALRRRLPIALITATIIALQAVALFALPGAGRSILASATAPLAATTLATTLGYTPLILTTATILALSAITLAFTRYRHVQTDFPHGD